MAQMINYCWRKIGVYGGDHSCTRLREVVHCRNCDIFSAAARSVMLRETDQLDDDVALVPEIAAVVRSALLLRIGGVKIGLPVACVIEVAADAPLRRVPHRSGRAVAGLTNVRGQLHLTLVPERLFGLEISASASQTEPEKHARPRIVLMRAVVGAPVALRADHVVGVHGFALDALGPIPESLPARLADCANAIGLFEQEHYFLLDDVKFADVLTEAINA